MVYRLEGHEDGINCLAISSDDSVLVSGSEDNTARVWSIEDKEPEEDLEDLDALFGDDHETNPKVEDERLNETEAKTSDEEEEEDNKEEEHEDKKEDVKANEIKTSLKPTPKNEGDERCLGVLRYA